MNKSLSIILLVLLVLMPQMSLGRESGAVEIGFHMVSAQNQAGEDPFDIQWFKKEMKISPKYLEKDQGVMGMSWAHFLTMVFLVIFFVGALIAVYMRNKRTKTILTSLLKEKNHESES